MRRSVAGCVAVLGLGIGISCFGSEAAAVDIVVKDDGKTCAIGKVEMECTRLPAVLRMDRHLARDSSIVVSPEGCGESALKRAGAIGNMLKAAGFSGVILVGFITEPHRQCGP